MKIWDKLFNDKMLGLMLSGYIVGFFMFIAGLAGWVMNIIILAGPEADNIILRVVGIFLVPLGVVLGYL